MHILMIYLIKLLFIVFKSKRQLIAENLLLRQQLEVIKRNKPDTRNKLDGTDRAIISISRNFVSHWRKVCYVYTPDTLLKWHRQLVKNHWRWISQKGNKVRNKINQEIKQLIIQMKKENLTWRAERIRGELLKLNIKVSKRTIQKILRSSRDYNPSPAMRQKWRSFLKNHAKDITCCDFFTVTTAFFKSYHVFFVLHHLTREIIHINITEHPIKTWIEQQLRESTPYLNKKTFLIHDHDTKFTYIDFNRLGLNPVCISYLAPNMNAYAERFVGSARRECLDHMIILNEKHLGRVLREYVKYYNTMRPHQGIGQNIPLGVPDKEDLNDGKIDKIPILGGLHHHYFRKACPKSEHREWFRAA